MDCGVLAPFLSAFPPTVDPPDTHMCTDDPSSPGVQRPRVSPEPAAFRPGPLRLVAVVEGSQSHPSLLVVCRDWHPFLQCHTASPLPSQSPPHPGLSEALSSAQFRVLQTPLSTSDHRGLPHMCPLLLNKWNSLEIASRVMVYSVALFFFSFFFFSFLPSFLPFSPLLPFLPLLPFVGGLGEHVLKTNNVMTSPEPRCPGEALSWDCSWGPRSGDGAEPSGGAWCPCPSAGWRCRLRRAETSPPH